MRAKSPTTLRNFVVASSALCLAAFKNVFPFVFLNSFHNFPVNYCHVFWTWAVFSPVSNFFKCSFPPQLPWRKVSELARFRTDMYNKPPNDPDSRPSARDVNEADGSSGFDRNKFRWKRRSENLFETNSFRQTMPSNSRFNPVSPGERFNKKRPAGPTKSPTQVRYSLHALHPTPSQSHVSTATNYAPPWNSPRFQTPVAAKRDAKDQEEPRFRRTHSVAARKGEQESEKKKERPRINFKEFSKSVVNKFKKGDSKKPLVADKSRMSAPIIKLNESSTSQPDLPTTSAAVSSPKKVIRASASLKMQPEDRMKMWVTLELPCFILSISLFRFQKMGREQSMKESNLQRMQRERQRDFTLVPGPGRACLEASTLSVALSNHSVDSMVVYSSPSRRSDSLSVVDGDVEPVFKNSLTKKNVTSAQMASMKNKNQNQNQTCKLSSGPSFTSTPKFSAASVITNSPTISNVRSISESSFCLMTNEPTPAVMRANAPMNRTNDTMYFSTVGISNAGRDTPSGSHPFDNIPPRTAISAASITSTSTTPTPNHLLTVKQEVVDPQESSASSSHCPSIASTSTPPADILQPIFAHPEQLNDLWMVSKAIREKQLSLERNIPAMNRVTARLEELDKQKIQLLDNNKDAPSQDDVSLTLSLP